MHDHGELHPATTVIDWLVGGSQGSPQAKALWDGLFLAGANLAGADLKGAHLQQAELEGASLWHAEIDERTAPGRDLVGDSDCLEWWTSWTQARNHAHTIDPTPGLDEAAETIGQKGLEFFAVHLTEDLALVSYVH